MSSHTRHRVGPFGLGSPAATLAAAALLSVAPLGWTADPKASGGRLGIEAVEIDPAKPGPGTLCTLKVVIRNDGATHHASAFAFKVSVNGEALSVYEKHVWMQPVAPGARSTVDLYNFWTPSKGSELAVEVTLAEAQWLKRTKDSDEWAGTVPGLPVSKTLKVPLGSPRR